MPHHHVHILLRIGNVNATVVYHELNLLAGGAAGYVGRGQYLGAYAHRAPVHHKALGKQYVVLISALVHLKHVVARLTHPRQRPLVLPERNLGVKRQLFVIHLELVELPQEVHIVEPRLPPVGVAVNDFYAVVAVGGVGVELEYVEGKGHRLALIDGEGRRKQRPVGGEQANGAHVRIKGLVAVDFVRGFCGEGNAASDGQR